jgi:hypothetical protein
MYSVEAGPLPLSPVYHALRAMSSVLGMLHLIITCKKKKNKKKRKQEKPKPIQLFGCSRALYTCREGERGVVFSGHITCKNRAHKLHDALSFAG